MDRENLLYGDRTTVEYERELENFISVAELHVASTKKSVINCPCGECKNFEVFQDPDIIREHLLKNGFDTSYTQWIWHGENAEVSNDRRGPVEENCRNDLEDMLDDVVNNFNDKPDSLATLIGDNKKPLYPGCTKYSRLHVVLALYHLKAANGWTDVSFTSLLTLLKDMLPEGNELPDRNYEAKKVLCPMGMECQRIHVCPNDCILYRNEYVDLKSCPKCNTSHYKKKRSSYDVENLADAEDTKVAAKVLCYLPVLSRFKRMFANPKEAENLVWHANRSSLVNDKKIGHTYDASQWKKFDTKYPEFGNDPRNLRLALSTDGMNPYGNLSSSHSSWPVMLVIFNLPPWIFVKRKYIMLTLMISGPKQPGNDIDVYLGPLLEDLKIL